MALQTRAESHPCVRVTRDRNRSNRKTSLVETRMGRKSADWRESGGPDTGGLPKIGGNQNGHRGAPSVPVDVTNAIRIMDVN